MLDELASNKMYNDLWGWSEGVALFKCCGRWQTAYAWNDGALAEIWRNENEQVGVFLLGPAFL